MLTERLNFPENKKSGHNVDNLDQEKFSPEFLEEQANLPPKQWDPEFKKLIEELTKENQKRVERDRRIAAGELVEEEKEMTEEEEMKEKYKSYLKFLALNEENLRGKKILDLGCGSEGFFIRYLLKYGITSEAYGIDLEIDEESIEPEYLKNFYQRDYNEEFPVSNVDYIFSVGAVDGEYIIGEITPELKNKIKRIILNCLSVLNEDGEIRIFAILEAAVATPQGLGSQQKKGWERILKEIAEELKIEYEFKPVDIDVVTKDNDIVLKYVLIIRKRKRR